MSTEKKKYFILLSVIILFIAIVIVISLSTLSSIKEQSKFHINESLKTILHTTQEAHHLWISYREREVRDLSESKVLLSFTQALLNSEDVKAISTTLKNLRIYIEPKLKRNNDKGFFIISPDRISIASMRDANLGTMNLIQTSRQTFLDNAFDGSTTFVPTFKSDVPLSLVKSSFEKKEPTSFILSPIINNTKEVIAVLAVRIDPANQFSRISQLGRLGDTGETYAFDKEGLLITESRFDHHLRKVGLITVDETAILSIRITDPGGNLLKGYKSTVSEDSLPLTLMAQSGTARKSGSNVDGYRDYRGVQVFGAWLWDKNLEFGMATEVDVAEALQPYYEARFSIVVAVTLIATLSFIFVFLVMLLQKKSKEKLRKSYNNLEVKIEARTKQLNLANKELELLAITDGLTGILNRRKFDEHIDMYLKLSIRERLTMSVIMIDVDYFKQFNDNYGHQAGDECLQRITKAIEEAGVNNRPGDIFARYGGEEFIVMLFDSSDQYTYSAAQKIQDMVRELKIPHEYNKGISDKIVTVSLGVCIEYSHAESSSAALITKADQALYKAKENGRNCVISYAQIMGVG